MEYQIWTSIEVDIGKRAYLMIHNENLSTHKGKLFAISILNETMESERGKVREGKREREESELWKVKDVHLREEISPS